MDGDRHLGGDAKGPLFDILEGLEEIHRRGFLHRDLKPANVLKFSDEDGECFYALSDFGLMAVGETDTSTLTPTGIGGGTLQYQAPECALNLKRATPQSDIYSFGALLFDIFAPSTSRLPHDELAFPGEIGEVVTKCTKRNPHRRFADVATLREALFDALDNFEFEFDDQESEAIIAPLSRDDFPSDDEWDNIFDLLDSSEPSSLAWQAAFRALGSEHISILAEQDSGLFNALGMMFAKHITSRTFDFDYCDVLAAKGQAFFDRGSIGLQAHIALGILELGTDHNRWAVERRFLRMVGPDSSDELAERIVVECEVQEFPFSNEYKRLMRSISTTTNALHPTLRELVAE